MTVQHTIPDGLAHSGVITISDPSDFGRIRTPGIEGTGETRLMLVLDPVDDPEDAA